MKFQPSLTRKTPVINSRFLTPYLAVILFISVAQASTQNTRLNDKHTIINSDQWSWKLLSHSMYESKVAIYFNNHLVKQYLVECNLANDNQDSQSDESSKIEKVTTNNNHTGLLLVTCISGAHSKLIEIYDPTALNEAPVFSKFGAYYAGWEKRNGQLFVFYDQACKANSKDCQQFEKVEILWPAR